MAGRVLVADQSDAIRSVAINLFRQKGYEVLAAVDGPQAWEIIKSGNVDLAILNSTLSGMDGYTISRLIKDDPALAATKTILLLSASEIVNQHQLITAQPDGTLTKPFTPSDLLHKTAAALNQESEPASPTEDLQDSVSVLGAVDEQTAKDIDFGSIFSDEVKASADDVQLSEILSDPDSDSHAAEKSTELPVGSDDERVEQVEEMPSKEKAGEDAIRLAEDQYGLEKPFEPPEVEVPHDYNWFIREMKSEIDPRHRPAQSPQTPPPKPRRSEETTGKFTVEEIKTAKIAIPDAKKTAAEQLFEKLVSEGTRDGVSEETSAGLEELAQKLSLAERLMIKELARLLAEKITEQIPREALLRMLAEALADLKKH